LTSK
jgi:WD40 repeat protein